MIFIWNFYYKFLYRHYVTRERSTFSFSGFLCKPYFPLFVATATEKQSKSHIVFFFPSDVRPSEWNTSGVRIFSRKLLLKIIRRPEASLDEHQPSRGFFFTVHTPLAINYLSASHHLLSRTTSCHQRTSSRHFFFRLIVTSIKTTSNIFCRGQL